MTSTPNTNDRCWFCGDKLVDKSRTLNKRMGFSVMKYNHIGILVCNNGCPSKEEHESYLKEKANIMTDFINMGMEKK